MKKLVGLAVLSFLISCTQQASNTETDRDATRTVDQGATPGAATHINDTVSISNDSTKKDNQEQ